MEWGIAKGLAVDLQYDQRIQDQRFYDQQFKRAQAENQAELKAFEDDTDYMNAANSFDHNIIKGEAEKTIKEMGQIIRDNPNYKYDPDVRRLLNEKKKYLKSNPNVIRGMASDENFKRLNDDLAKVAKNPTMYDSGAYEALLAKKQNYLAYGHQDGKEAATKFGPQAFVYDKPEDFIDLPTTAIEIGNKYKSDKYHGDGNGGHYQVIDETTLRPIAENLYKQRQRQIQVQHGVKSDEEGIQVAANMIRAGIKLERKFAEPNHALIAKQWEYKMKQMEDRAIQTGKPLDAYNATFRDPDSSVANPELITKMIGITPTVKLYDAENKFVSEVSNREFVPKGTYMQVPKLKQDKNGKWVQDNGETIGVIHGYSIYSEQEIKDSGWLKDPKMSKNIEKKTIKTKSGEDENVYQYKTQYTFNPRNAQSFALKFNNDSGETTKQISSMNPVGDIPQKEIEVYADGSMFDAVTKQYLGKKQ